MENTDIDRTKSRMVDVETNTPSTWDNLEEKLKEEFPKVAEKVLKKNIETISQKLLQFYQEHNYFLYLVKMYTERYVENPEIVKKIIEVRS